MADKCPVEKYGKVYKMPPKVAAILREFWPQSRAPKGKGERARAFGRDMQHMQIALIKEHFPRMGLADAARARRTLAYLEAELIAPGSAGAYPVGVHHV